MSEPIHDYGTDAAGNKIDRGIFCIDPSGHLIVVPPNQPIKAGWCVAHVDDVTGEVGPGERVVPRIEPGIGRSAPAGTPFFDEPVEAVVESISIDAPYGRDRD